MVTNKTANEYDVIIIGGGPAGLSAGIYTARARLNSVLIEKGMFGGEIVNTDNVENYPGFADGINGFELTQSMYQQATKFGLKTITSEVTGIELKRELKAVKTTHGDFTAKAVIITSGSLRQKLGIPGEEEYTGKGVSVCATCDAAFFSDRPVAVVGGGNAAITEALQLSKFASRVTVIHRRSELRATRILQEKAFAEPKIEFLWDTVVAEIQGGDFVNKIKLRQVTTNQESTLDIAGIFVSAGQKPNTDYLKGTVPLNDKGAIITNDKLETEVAGIFAAGDVRQNSILQAIAAAGDGATAAIYAERYLSQ